MQEIIFYQAVFLEECWSEYAVVRCLSAAGPDMRCIWETISSRPLGFIY